MIPEQWTTLTYKQFAAWLPTLADKKYRAFHQRLVPNIKNLLGIRLPQLRTLSKQIAKTDVDAYLAVAQCSTYEETMLQGLVIGDIKQSLPKTLAAVRSFVPKINNWAICDSFCAGLKITKKYPGEMFEFLLPYLNSSFEFEHRFALVMLMDYYINAQYIDRVLEIYDSSSSAQYYVQMAVAWGLSVCFVKYEKQTLNVLNCSALDDFTYNKALQKIIESHRVSTETKQMIRAMKRK